MPPFGIYSLRDMPPSCRCGDLRSGPSKVCIRSEFGCTIGEPIDRSDMHLILERVVVRFFGRGGRGVGDFSGEIHENFKL